MGNNRLLANYNGISIIPGSPGFSRELKKKNKYFSLENEREKTSEKKDLNVSLAFSPAEKAWRRKMP